MDLPPGKIGTGTFSSTFSGSLTGTGSLLGFTLGRPTVSNKGFAIFSPMANLPSSDAVRVLVSYGILGTSAQERHFSFGTG